MERTLRAEPVEIEAVRLWVEGRTDAEIACILVGDAGDYARNARNGRRLRLQGLRQLGFDGTGNDLLRRCAAERLQCSQERLQCSHPSEVHTRGLHKNTVTVPGDLFAQQVAHFESLLSRTPGRVEAPPERRSAHRKILVVSDLHFPFAHERALEHAITHHGDADVLVVLGDMFDCYAASRFRKQRLIDIRTELQMGAAFLEVVARRFPKVYLVKGNHESRPLRWLEEHRPEIAPLMLHPYDYIQYSFTDKGLIRRFDNVEVPTYRALRSAPGYDVLVQHFVCIGDALLGHFEKSNKGPLRTGYLLTLEWLPQWRREFGLGEIRCLVEAHVHRLGKSVFGDVLIFESGCMSHVMDYAVASPDYSPPQVGYVVLYQRDGVTDWNESFYYVHQEV